MNKTTALTIAIMLASILALANAAGARGHGQNIVHFDEHLLDRHVLGEHSVDEHHSETPFISQQPSGALHVTEIIGTTVKQRVSGAGIGVIQGLIIGEDGRIISAVIMTGNLLGLGGHEVGVNWGHLEHTMERGDSVFYVNMDDQTLQNAPRHERD